MNPTIDTAEKLSGLSERGQFFAALLLLGIFALYVMRHLLNENKRLAQRAEDIHVAHTQMTEKLLLVMKDNNEIVQQNNEVISTAKYQLTRCEELLQRFS